MFFDTTYLTSKLWCTGRATWTYCHGSAGSWIGILYHCLLHIPVLRILELLCHFNDWDAMKLCCNLLLPLFSSFLSLILNSLGKLNLQKRGQVNSMCLMSADSSAEILGHLYVLQLWSVRIQIRKMLFLEWFGCSVSKYDMWNCSFCFSSSPRQEEICKNRGYVLVIFVLLHI